MPTGPATSSPRPLWSLLACCSPTSLVSFQAPALACADRTDSPTSGHAHHMPHDWPMSAPARTGLESSRLAYRHPAPRHTSPVRLVESRVTSCRLRAASSRTSPTRLPWPCLCASLAKTCCLAQPGSRQALTTCQARAHHHALPERLASPAVPRPANVSTRLVQPDVSCSRYPSRRARISSHVSDLPSLAPPWFVPAHSDSSCTLSRPGSRLYDLPCAPDMIRPSLL